MIAVNEYIELRDIRTKDNSIVIVPEIDNAYRLIHYVNFVIDWLDETFFSEAYNTNTIGEFAHLVDRILLYNRITEDVYFLTDFAAGKHYLDSLLEMED